MITPQRIDEAIEVLDAAYEQFRFKQNVQILNLADAAKHVPHDLTPILKTLDGSLFAHNRKFEKIKGILRQFKQELQNA